MTNNVEFDFKCEFENRHYKSFFARSMAVHSQQNQPKSMDFTTGSENEKRNDGFRKEFTGNRPGPTVQNRDGEEVKMRKNNHSPEDSRRYSCGNLYSSMRRSSMCPTRITEIPVENMVNQTKLETLEWQLKEIQKSREMYRAVMKQIVTYLEKAHHSLELLGSRINRRNSVHRSRSEYQMESTRFSDLSTLSLGNQSHNRTLDEHKIKDLQWQQSKPEEPSPEEFPPEKLAQEAFRLLRTAQSLLNTREPDLAQMPPCEPVNDIEFLQQLAKEFPPPENKPQRATSFSLSPKLITPETDNKIATAFNRKLSLQLSDVRRTSRSFRNVDSARCSVAESDTDVGGDVGVFCSGVKTKSEKSNSPKNGSISSVEDESGFSSMNSFQEIGLPLVNSTMTEEVSTKTALLRSMLHNNSNYNSLNFSLDQDSFTDSLSNSSCKNSPKEERKPTIDNIRLWQKPGNVATSMPPLLPPPPQHKRWSSTPIKEAESQNFKVLWV